MKTKMLSLVCVFLMGTMAVFAQSKTESFEVKGMCGMCEKRIEKAAKSVGGVTAADWNNETSMMSVTFDASKTDLDKIEASIAKVGHDTPLHKADDKVYKKLPGCCQYDRAETKKDMKDEKMDMKGHEGHQH